MWDKISKHPFWSAVIVGLFLPGIIWLFGYYNLEAKAIATLDSITAPTKDQQFAIAIVILAIMTALLIMQTVRVGRAKRRSQSFENEANELRYALHDELGIVAFRDAARETIEIGLDEAKGHYRWQGYSSVNVVTPVPNERIIRKKSEEGVCYEFEILNPNSTHGYLLHALHEENSEEQGRGYIERALSAIQEMRGDGVNISYRFSNLPPVLRLVTLDSERIFVGIYPKGKCGIDGKELEIKNNGDGSLYQFFFEYQKRLQAINEFYDDRDYVIGLILRRYCDLNELTAFLRNLKIASVKSDHFKIIAKELPHLATISRKEVDEATISAQKESKHMSLQSETALLTKSSVSASEQNAKIVEHVAAVFDKSPPLSELDLSQGLLATTKRQLIFDADTFKGVKVPSIGSNGSMQRRVLSSWLVHHLYEEKAKHTDLDELPCAVLAGTKFTSPKQFSLSEDENLLVFWGEHASAMIAALVSAHEAFDPDDFDEDGYKK